ncbi:TonB-dependent receptor-like protein [Nostoc sp. 3335mG]|nr:TonB-dependent receptor-like protein [Nostoc sp. 3335mG]
MNLSHRLMFGAATSAMLIASAACGLSDQIYSFDLPAQPLKTSLRQVTQTSGIDLFAMSEDLADRQAPPLRGQFTVVQAVDKLLVGSGLTGQLDGRRMFIRPLISNAGSDGTPQIVVTGSRIRGVPGTSPVTVISQADMVDAGQSSIGEAVRDLPQNFGGGQNPGVIGGGAQGIANQNLNSASTINLRGLGPDATLTLLNGHRLAYGSNIQGVDVDSIPIAALDRIEIVTDGASAVYGSDAVAGVANVILKRDYTGLLASGRFGAATDGGDTEQQYSLTGGSKWESGGFMAVADFRRSTAIYADQRSYTGNLDRTTTLLPWIHQVSGILTGHQDVAPSIHFSFDALFNRRTSRTQLPETETESYLIDGTETHMRDRAISFSPKLSFDIGRSWSTTLLGTWGIDDTLGSSLDYSGGVASAPLHYTYNNMIRMGEVNAEGPLLRLPAGNVRLALGGGYRSNRFDVELTQPSPSGPHLVDQRSSRNSYFAYGEMSIPLVSPGQSISLVRSLALSGAVRYENYPGLASLATPKVGAVYAPTADVDVKFSWGQSFKTPTLYQEHQAQYVTLLPAAVLGASGSPAGSAAIIRTGGNTALKPERANGWTASIDFHPQSVPHLNVGGSFFKIRYRDRIIMPVSSITGSLSDPLYAPFVTDNPDAEFLGSVLASTTQVFNYSGAPYAPGNVVAVVDDRVQNVSRQSIHGVDLTADYDFDLRQMGHLHLNGALSYLHSNQQFIPGQPLSALAGTIFNPPHWRGRGGVQWVRDVLTLSAFVTYIGGTSDNRLLPATRVRGMAPVDLSARTHFASSVPWLNGIDAELVVRNVQNVKPAIIRNLSPAEPSYDSANYSAIGRAVSLTLSKAL